MANEKIYIATRKELNDEVDRLDDAIDSLDATKADQATVQDLQNEKQDKLTAGAHVSIDAENVITVDTVAAGTDFVDGAPKMKSLDVYGNKYNIPDCIEKTEGIKNVWSGTLAEYNAIATKDENTLYNILDDNTSLDYATRVELFAEVARAETAENNLQGQITGLAGVVKVKIVETQPEEPVNGTMYYIGTASPYVIKLYVNDTWYDMGTSTVDLSDYRKRAEQDVIDAELVSDISALETKVDAKQNKLTSANAGTNITIDTTDPNVPKISATGSGLTLQSVYDMIYPVGSRYMGIDAPNVPTGITATWEKDNSVNGFYLQVNNNATPGTTGAEEATCENVVLTADQLPKHSHNMQHYHNRGTMDITGKFSVAPSLSSSTADSLCIKLANGAFYNAGSTDGITRRIMDIDASYERYDGGHAVGFKASSSWSGLTSTTLDSGGNKITNTAITGANEPHKHKISSIEPRKLFAGLWKRTA